MLLRSKLIALNLGASEIIESKRCRCIIAELFKTCYTFHKGETETKSDSFACCEHVRKMGGFFCMFDFCLSVSASGPAFLPRVEAASSFLNI